ncbi:uncharacterized protein LY89DRAFT_733725 [Mollisia scopiformis]|uniref:Uncharacterized protein n=1 Tax=Mollisia scopiformis TaxID=149040 RepID=A0A194X974_MOLSC|nr:uncharacterized protein LY89DRAFT_733725 [Mollisia scopiformis]KUJ16718.1 hypothetical protein LY89DRAFT_733725 [Mollisia scopiformis]
MSNTDAAPCMTAATDSFESDETPETYAEAISAHARKIQKNSFVCGANYRDFSKFVNLSPSERNIQLLDQLQPDLTRAHRSVVCLRFDSDGTRQPNTYAGTEGPQSFLDRTPLKTGCAEFLFIRGYPSAEWIRVIGSQLRIDPEVFRRHAGRQHSSGDIRRNYNALVKHGVAGQSIVRRYSIHNENTYTIDQLITFCVVKKNGGYTAVICLDTGRDLRQGPEAPWNKAEAEPDSCLPTIQHPAKVALRTNDQTTSFASEEDADRLLQSTSIPTAKHLPLQYGMLADEDQSLMRSSPIYALNELFLFAASSNSQFLNFVKGQVEDALLNAQSHEGQEELSLINLRFTKDLLEENIGHYSEVIAFLQSKLAAKWKGSDADLAQDVQDSILRDFESLLRRAKELAARCLDGTAIIMNGAMLRESRKAIEQAEKVERLTILALIFVPLSFITSAFGMNFKELGQGEVGMQVFAEVAVPVLCVSLIICFWGRIHRAITSLWD